VTKSAGTYEGLDGRCVLESIPPGNCFTWALNLLLIAMLLPCQLLWSQANPGGQDTSQETTKEKTGQVVAEAPREEKAAPPKKRLSFVFAPIPISSPALGSGVVPVVGVIFPLRKNDTVSEPSTIGAAGLITNNGSRAFAVGGQIFFSHDDYR